MCYHVLEKGKFYKETIWTKSVWPEWDMKLHFLAEESVQSTAKNDRSAKALYSWKIMCMCGKEDKSNIYIYIYEKKYLATTVIKNYFMATEPLVKNPIIN